MSAKTSLQHVDRTKIRTEWEAMRNEYHTLVDSIPPTAFRHSTIDTRWTIAEILTHMVQTIELMPRAIKSLRRGKDFINLPNMIVESTNFFLVKMIALNITPKTLLTRYDQAFDIAMQVWDRVDDDEWDKGACYLGEGYKTLADYYKNALAHFDEHAAQIRKSLNSTER